MNLCKVARQKGETKTRKKFFCRLKFSSINQTIFFFHIMQVCCAIFAVLPQKQEILLFAYTKVNKESRLATLFVVVGAREHVFIKLFFTLGLFFIMRHSPLRQKHLFFSTWMPLSRLCSSNWYRTASSPWMVSMLVLWMRRCGILEKVKMSQLFLWVFWESWHL